MNQRLTISETYHKIGDHFIYIKNIWGDSIKVHDSLFVLNHIILVLILIVSGIILIHKLDHKMNLLQEVSCKIKYISTALGASLGLIYPIWGLIGLNSFVLIWLIIDLIYNNETSLETRVKKFIKKFK
jgi:hypothetical protein